jgi:exopolysaccharide production protein ExoZ
VNKEVVSVQYLRGLAAVLVVLHHLFSTMGLEYLYSPHLGDFGVEIFFVISGFIMWHTTAAAEISTFEFWRRRVIRVVPLYWIFLLCLVIISLSGIKVLNSTVITPENAIKSFLFIPHYHATQNIIAPILIPGWSLNYEMFFYFLFGLSLLVPKRRTRAMLLGAILLGLVLLGFVMQQKSALMITYTGSGLLKFFDGMVLAMICRAKRLGGAILGVTLISIGLISRSIFGSSYIGALDGFVGLSPALVVGGSLGLETAARRMPSFVLHTIGNASYSIYLSHLFFLRLSELVSRHFLLLGSSTALDTIYVAVALAFAITGGVMVYRLIERPILFLMQRRHVANSANAAI